MDSPERSSRGYSKRDMEDGSDVKSDRLGDDEERESGDKRKHGSSKSRKPGNVEDAEAFDGSGRRRSSGGDRYEGRKRPGGSGRGDSDEDDYNARKELRSMQLKKQQEESSLEKLSSWYQDGDLENKRCGDRSGRKGYGWDESERRKTLSKVSEDEIYRGGSKSKEEWSYDVERKESSRERAADVGRNQRRRWDESDDATKAEEKHHEKADGRSVKGTDPKHDNSRERSSSGRNDYGESKSRVFDSSDDKGLKTNSRDDNKDSPIAREERSGREKNEKPRNHGDEDEDETAWTREKRTREGGRSNRSRTPERSGRHRQESQPFDDRSGDIKRKDAERGDRSKGRDESWIDRNRERDSSKEGWNRRTAGNDKELNDGDIFYDRSKDREPRHGRERNDHDRPHGRNRGEAVKTSSNFGISNENYDVIEIQTKPLDYGRADAKAVTEEWAYTREEGARRHDGYSTEDLKEKSLENDISVQGQWRDDTEYPGSKGRGQRGSMSGRGGGSSQNSSTGSQPSYANQEPGSFNRGPQQGMKGSRVGRAGRGRPTGRDNQQVTLPLPPIMGSPFGPLGIPPPGPIQPLPPNMLPAPGPPISPGVFIPPFSPPVVWPGARGVEMNMLGVPPSLPPVPPGPGPRFPPSIGTPLSNPAMFFNQTGPGRGVVPPIMSGPGFTSSGPVGQGTPPDKAAGGGNWVPPRSGGPPGKAPSRGEQNDYSQNFVDTGMRPQNFIRELELTNVVEDYPKLRDLIQKKDEIVAKAASPAMYMKCDLRELELSPELFGTKFDVILVDPPWEEYVHRAPGVADHMEYWTFEEILNLKIEAIADTPSFIFLWVGDGVGLEQGRQCLKKWGFRRCEDICWVKTNKTTATPGLRHDSQTLFQHSKEHCLMGIKGTVRRSTDGHIIHANIDTDVIIAEEPPYGSTEKPEDMYRIIEHFALGRRRLELFGEDHNIRPGWLTAGKGLSTSNFNEEAYLKNFADKDGKVWQGGGGRNPPPDAPHLVQTTPEIEALRPKSPMKNQQLQSTTSIPLTTANSTNRRTSANSPQNPSTFTLNQEASSSNPSTPARPWGSSSMEGFRGRDRESGAIVLEDNKVFDMYGGYGGTGNGEFIDFESQRQMHLL